MHIVNEACLITLCLILILSTPGVYQDFNSDYMSERAILVIIFLSLFIIINLVMIVYDMVVSWCKPHCLRRRNIIEFRTRNRHHSKLINKRNKAMAEKLKLLLKDAESKRKAFQ